MENPLDNCESHKEKIVCPNCTSIQDATVYHTVPFVTAIHECSECHCIIMESEWQRIEN